MTGTKIAATSGLAGASELRAITQDSAGLPRNRGLLKGGRLWPPEPRF